MRHNNNSNKGVATIYETDCYYVNRLGSIPVRAAQTPSYVRPTLQRLPVGKVLRLVTEFLMVLSGYNVTWSIHL
jgi:hypothetical protein